MDTTGCSREEVLALLSGYRALDTPYDHIFSSMCTIPLQITEDVRRMFAATNLGDPSLFPGTAKIESLLVESLGDMLHCRTAAGWMTSGGTESNIQAIRVATKLKKTNKPNIVIPVSAHFSFEKIADMLGIELRVAPYEDGKYTVDTDAMAELIDRNTIALSALAGSTEYGVVDDIETIGRLSLENETFFHVDAAFGGFVIPFLPRLIPFDFAVPGVDSISLDPHKMGMGTIPGGCLLFRNSNDQKTLSVQTPYLMSKEQTTLTGTRPGADVAAAYAVVKYLGNDGFRAIVAGCMENTRRLTEGLTALGYEKVLEPVLNLTSFHDFPIPDGWKVSHTREQNLRFVCMPHVTRDVVEAFLCDVAASQKE
ncbi:MAG TPA: tyrosine decarboxylase MfnA [Methanocorpusculum sp.]|nr:tyrosine decarboxylase MfnA [Methanocorpusculum sp.]